MPTTKRELEEMISSLQAQLRKEQLAHSDTRLAKERAEKAMTELELRIAKLEASQGQAQGTAAAFATAFERLCRHHESLSNAHIVNTGDTPVNMEEYERSFRERQQ